jgi:perosamine synthetase
LNNYWVYGIVFPTTKDKELAVEKLRTAEIETRPFFWPLHLQPANRDKSVRIESSMKNSEYLGQNGIYLPLGQHVTKSIQEQIIEEL